MRYEKSCSFMQTGQSPPQSLLNDRFQFDPNGTRAEAKCNIASSRSSSSSSPSSLKQFTILLYYAYTQWMMLSLMWTRKLGQLPATTSCIMHTCTRGVCKPPVSLSFSISLALCQCGDLLYKANPAQFIQCTFRCFNLDICCSYNTGPVEGLEIVLNGCWTVQI